MATPLKNKYDDAYIEHLAHALKKAHSAFHEKEFMRAVQDEHWHARELKARMRHITICLHEKIDLPYKQVLNIFQEICQSFGGYHGMFFPDYVEQYGLGHWRESINALEYLTQFSSSEFAVRAFIRADQKRMMAQMEKWSKHENHHVRRLASEGCRPRLPWATFLPTLQQNPQPIFRILENLQRDESLYVRKSVANNLNDIAKNHPELVLELAAVWQKKHQHTDWILKRACRTLLKQTNANALALFDYKTATHVSANAFHCPEKIRMGENLTMQLCLQSTEALGLLRIEYVIGFLRANGQHNQKVFQWTEKNFAELQVHLSKKHAFLPLSTRTLHAGNHTLCVRINGKTVVQHAFDLLLSSQKPTQ